MSDRTATIHSTNCHSYVVSLDDTDPAEHRLCHSLEEAYDLLRRHGVAEAALAQRLPADEVAGAGMVDSVSYMPVKVPSRRGP